MKLDRTQPFGTTYGPDAATIPFMQNGVYFDARGDVVDCPYNRDNHRALFSSAPAGVADTGAPPPTAADVLNAKTEAEIYAGAVRLRESLGDQHEDGYVPDPSDKAGNIEFILRHASVGA